MAAIQVGQMVTVAAMHKENRPGVVLQVTPVGYIVVVAGSTKDLDPDRHEVRKGSLAAKEMGLSETTFFSADGVLGIEADRVQPRKQICPMRVLLKLEQRFRVRGERLLLRHGIFWKQIEQQSAS